MKGNTRFQSRLEWLLVASIAMLAGPGLAGAQTAEVTYARDVAPILQAKCQECHRPGNVAPMSLLTYDEVRPWAPLIADKVAKRVMPPWPIDMNVGIQEFKNDRSLSEDQIATIVQWAASGAPMGDPADEPPPIEWPDWANSWKFEQYFGRPPDVVVASPPYLVVADGMDQWPCPQAQVTGIDSDRWIRAIELRPATPESRYVFHHANSNIANREAEFAFLDVLSRQQGASNRGPTLVESAIGTDGYIFPEGSGRLIQPDDIVQFRMHLFPSTEDVLASLEIGMWLYPKGEVPPHPTESEVQWSYGGLQGMENNALILPPNSVVTYRGTFKLEEAARIHSLRGHMHMRGKFQTVEVIYPDGRYEFINKLNWDHGWHTAFLYEDWTMPLLPKGTTVILTSVHDNTANNPTNPDPDQWVVGGARTVDEMHNLRLGITYYPDEAEFNALVAERERVLAERERQRQQTADQDR